MIAIVTGASRGAGRGIAVELGAIGATVYVTGRTTRDQQPAAYDTFKRSAGFERMPGNDRIDPDPAQHEFAR